jgi:hypothetical protein
MNGERRSSPQGAPHSTFSIQHSTFASLHTLSTIPLHLARRKEEVNLYDRTRWILIVGALLLAVSVGWFAYDAGLEQGVEQSGKMAPGTTVASDGHHGWHHWRGDFFFPPFFHIIIWIVILRMIFGCGRWHRRGWGRCGGLDDWHDRAHERMNQPGGGPTTR